MTGCCLTSLMEEKLRPRKLLISTRLVFVAGSTRTNCAGLVKSPSSQKTICWPSLLLAGDPTGYQAVPPLASARCS